MATLAKEKLLIFTGAGFSNALVGKMFTTQGFYRRLREDGANEWPHLAYFSGLINERTDVETLAREISAAKHAVNVLAPKLGDYIAIRRSTGSSVADTSSQKLSAGFQEMLDRINSKVIHELDCTKISTKDADNINSLKDFLRKLEQMFSFNIFTTNYDNLMREHVLFNKNYYLEYKDNTSNVVNMDKLVDEGKPYSYIPLKGMLDWQRLDGDAVIEKHSFENDIQKSIIMSLEETGEPSGYPHDFLYDKFKEDLIEAERLLFIGFSFRDKPINNIIKNQKLKAKTACIVTLDSEPEQLKKFKEHLGGIFPKKIKLTFYKDGFNEAAQKKILGWMKS